MKLCFVIGAAQADVAVLVINATKGEFETGFDAGGQTREHALLARSLGKLFHPTYLSLSQCSPLICRVYFTSMAVFLLQLFNIFWSRSPRILKQP